MTIQSEIAKDRANQRALIKRKAKEANDLRGKVIRAYQNGIVEGRDEDDLREEIKQRFDITERRLDNCLDYAARFGNPKAQALTESRVLTHLQKIERDIIDVRDDCDRQLDRIDELEADGQDWYEIEMKDSFGGKNSGTETKKIPCNEARYRLMKRKAEALDWFFNAVKSLRGNTQIVNIMNGTAFSDMTHEDLAARIKQLEKQNRIEGGVYNVGGLNPTGQSQGQKETD